MLPLIHQTAVIFGSLFFRPQMGVTRRIKGVVGYCRFFDHISVTFVMNDVTNDSKLTVYWNLFLRLSHYPLKGHQGFRGTFPGKRGIFTHFSLPG